MNRTIKLVFETIQFLALGLWLGALVTTLLLNRLGGVSPAFIGTQSAMIELWGLVMVGILWVKRRQFAGNRKLFLEDGIRQLVTFAALFTAEYIKHRMHPVGRQASGSLANFVFVCTPLETGLIVLQIGLLALVCLLSVDLLMRGSQPRTAPLPAGSNGSSSVSPVPVAATSPVNPARKPGSGTRNVRKR